MRTTARGSLARALHRLDGRRIVLVDIENLVGGAASSAAVAWAKRALRSAIHLEWDDHVVIGTSHIGLLAVGCTWPDLRYVVRSGVDGADLALLDVLGENLAERFDRVVLASGDGIFTDAVAGIGAQGVRVTVVAHRDALSRRLRLAAGEVVYLDDRFPSVAAAGIAQVAA